MPQTRSRLILTLSQGKINFEAKTLHSHTSFKLTLHSPSYNGILDYGVLKQFNTHVGGCADFAPHDVVVQEAEGVHNPLLPLRKGGTTCRLLRFLFC